MQTFYTSDKKEVGIDEAGCGAFCGPVVAAGVILPRKTPAPDEQKLFDKIKDSKKITSEKVRKDLSDFIKNYAEDYFISNLDNNQIDKINILQARFKVYHEIIENLEPELILIDGNQYKDIHGIPYYCFEKGDSKYKSIAAASILAKVARDEYISSLSQYYPEFNWDKNKGYGTKDHLEAIKNYGLTPYHRKTYGICAEIEKKYKGQ
jgi:ribonuclease HII